MPDTTLEQIRSLVKASNPGLAVDLVQNENHDSYDLILHGRVKSVQRLTGQELSNPPALAEALSRMLDELNDRVWEEYGFARRAEIVLARHDEAWERQVLSILMGRGVLFYEAQEVVKQMKKGLPT